MNSDIPQIVRVYTTEVVCDIYREFGSCVIVNGVHVPVENLTSHVQAIMLDREKENYKPWVFYKSCMGTKKSIEMIPVAAAAEGGKTTEPETPTST